MVRRRRLLSREEFLDLLGASQLIPGPSSTELAIHIGYRLAGRRGLLVAGLCFILPAYLLTLAFAWAYVRFGGLPQTAGLLYGVKPVVAAVVAQAIWSLGRTALKSRRLIALGLLVAGAALLKLDPAPLLLGAGLLTASRPFLQDVRAHARSLALLIGVALVLLAAPFLIGRFVTPPAHAGATPLFLVFLKIGSVVYGSGYVLLAFLREELTTRRRWLSPAQLLDAVAVGQVTPGPVFSTATFIGYVLAGPWGALAATVGIFLPAFLFVALSGPLIAYLRRSPAASAFLDGVNAASLGLMAAVLWPLGRAAVLDPLTLLLAVGSAVLLLRIRINSAWLVLGGALLGIARFMLFAH